MQRRKRQRFWMHVASALVLTVALAMGTTMQPAQAETSSLPTWAQQISVAGNKLDAVEGWSGDGYSWTTTDVGVPGISRITVYSQQMLDIVINGDVTLDGASLVDVAGEAVRLNLNIDLSNRSSDLAITRVDQGPALVVSDVDDGNIDCTMMLEAGASGGAECLVDRMQIDDGAAFQVVYQEQDENKSSNLKIGENLQIDKGATFNAWAIGNSHLTVVVDEQATVDNEGTMTISGTEFDNNGSIINQGTLSLDIAGFNNYGTMNNTGSVKLRTAALVNHHVFDNHATVAIGAISTFENADGTVNNGDSSDKEAASIAVADSGRFINAAGGTLENHAPVTLDGRAAFDNSDLEDTHCTYHCFVDGDTPTYTEPRTCYVCKQEVYETDTVAPSGSLSINGVTYTDLSGIAETIAVNPGAPVALTAEDGQTGLSSLSYYLSDKILNDKEVAAIDDWQCIEFDEDGEAAVRIGPDAVQDVAGLNRFALYVKLEDNAGHGAVDAKNNVTYLGSPLVTIDKTAPVVEGLVDGGNYTGDVQFTVSDSDGEAIHVTLDGATLTPNADGIYVIPADDSSHTVVVSSGTHTLSYTVTVMKPATPEEPSEPDEPALVLYNIKTLSGDGGSLNLSTTLAAEGQSVYVDVKSDQGYQLDAVTVRDEADNDVAIKQETDGRYVFTMPNADVTVSAAFSADDGEVDAFPFIDVTKGDWFYDDVHDVWEKGLVGGMTENLYMPQEPMTRAMTVTILSRFEGDIATVPGPWYESARHWAMENGISDGTAMEANVTREQLATMLWRYANFKGYDVSDAGDLSAFVDADKISDFAEEGITWATGAGILGGKEGGVLDPGGNATRAEFAAMINRFCALYDL